MRPGESPPVRLPDEEVQPHEVLAEEVLAWLPSEVPPQLTPQLSLAARLVALAKLAGKESEVRGPAAVW